MEFIISLIKVVWALPWTLLGCGVGVLALVTGGGYRREGVVLEFWGGILNWGLRRVPIAGGAAAITFGHTILGRSLDDLTKCRPHELIHVKQYERWGPFFIPAYVLGSVWSWIRRRSGYWGNPFEREAFGAAPSQVAHMWRLLFFILASFMTAICGICLVAALFARMNWLAELATHFQTTYAVVLVCGAIVWWICGRFHASVFCLVIAALPLARLAPFYWPPNAPFTRPTSGKASSVNPEVRSDSWKAISANLHYNNRNAERAVAFLREQSAAIVAISEVNEFWQSKLESLADVYPHARFVPRSDSFGMALLSQLPMVDLTVETTPHSRVPFIATRVSFQNQMTLVVAVHVVPPTRAERAANRNYDLTMIADWIEANRGNDQVLVLGDFNCTPWSPNWHDFILRTQLADCRKGFGVQGSWPSVLPILRIPIDHILLSEELQVRSCHLGPNLGSDHLPLIVNLSLAGGQQRNLDAP